jgi:hypothetical protein
LSSSSDRESRAADFAGCGTARVTESASEARWAEPGALWGAMSGAGRGRTTTVDTGALQLVAIGDVLLTKRPGSLRVTRRM